MKYSLYMIDGLGEPPPSWFTLGHRLNHALNLGGVQFFDRTSKQLVRNMMGEEPGTKIIEVGHSLGAFEACKQSQKIDIFAAATIEIVRPDWWTPWGWWFRYDPVGCNATHARTWRKKKGAWPSCGLIGDESRTVVVPDTDHNSIIAKVESDVIEWMRGIL